jgi:hypothetical protein
MAATRGALGNFSTSHSGFWLQPYTFAMSYRFWRFAIANAMLWTNPHGTGLKGWTLHWNIESDIFSTLQAYSYLLKMFLLSLWCFSVCFLHVLLIFTRLFLMRGSVIRIRVYNFRRKGHAQKKLWISRKSLLGFHALWKTFSGSKYVLVKYPWKKNYFKACRPWFLYSGIPSAELVGSLAQL